MVAVEYLVFSFLGAAATIGIGAWLFLLEPGRPLPRAFALFLVLRGALGVARIMMFLEAADPAAVAFWSGLQGYFDVALLPSFAYFALWFFAGKARWGPAARGGVVLVAIVAEVLYAFDHCLLVCRGGTPASGIGPLSLLSAPTQLFIAAFGFALAIVWRREASHQRANLLISAGLVLTVLLEAGAFMAGLASDGYDELLRRNGGGAYGTFTVIVTALAFFVALAAVGLWAFPGPARPARRDAYRLLWLVAAVLASDVAIEAVSARPILGPLVTFFLFGLWRLVLVLLVAVALVRHRLFDLDWRLRVGVSKGTLATVALTAFFVASQMISQAAQTQLADASRPWVQYVGAALIGVALYFLHPLQRMADRMAQHAVPDAKPMGQMNTSERRDLYVEHVRLAWEDGQLQRKERLLLDNLRQRLGLSAADGAELEAEVLRTPQPGRRRSVSKRLSVPSK